MKKEDINTAKGLITRYEKAKKDYENLHEMIGEWTLIKLKVMDMRPNGKRADIEVPSSLLSAQDIVYAALGVLQAEMTRCEDELFNL